MSQHKKQLYRNTERGKIAGVCAGIADYFGWETWLVRILVVSGVLWGLPILILGYIAAWFILDKTPKVTANHVHSSSSASHEGSQSFGSSRESDDIANESIKVKTRIWQSGEPAKQALYDIHRKFTSLENKVQAMEQYVTSTEFTVSREINKL